MKSIETRFGPEQLSVGRAINKEKGVLEKFRGRTKEIAGLLMLVSALSFLPETIKEKGGLGSEEGGPQPQTAEKEKTPEQQAVDFLKKLFQLPDNPSATNPAHNDLLKARAARVLIQAFALQRKSPEAISGRVSPEDIGKALVELNKASLTFADQVLGNKNGRLDPEEMRKLNEESGKNPGLKAFTLMFVDFAEQK